MDLQPLPRVTREVGLVKALIGVHVFVVDDDACARELIGAALTYCGAFVTSVASARAALDSIDDAHPHVVVSAVSMPGEDGYWLVRQIRARGTDARAIGRARAIPVVALSEGREHGPDRTLGAGFVAHLRKPVDPWELCRIVASLARKA